LQLNQQRPAQLKSHNIREATFHFPLKLVLSSLDENGNAICKTTSNARYQYRI